MIISTINGTIGLNAEVKQINSTTKLLSFNVAAGKRKTAQNEYETIWVKCVKFYNNDNTIYNVEHLVKGAKVCVSGKMDLESYISKTNEFKAILKLNVDNFELIEKNTTQQNTQSNNITTNQVNYGESNIDTDFPF